MRRETGEKEFPIWLLGDSNPDRYVEYLDYPFDPRHPVVHNIWTSVIDVIQDKLFRLNRLRIDSKRIYIRNAIENRKYKPKNNDKNWSEIGIQGKLKEFRADVHNFNPLIIFPFGSFAFEFTQRALFPGEKEEKYIHWNTKNLGIKFKERINNFNLSATNIIPLLHRSISGGRFRESHKAFCPVEENNYFDYVGNSIAEKLITCNTKLKIWID